MFELELQAAAEVVGKKIAELCREKKIRKVAFDRGGFKYHGRVKVRVCVCVCVCVGVVIVGG